MGLRVAALLGVGLCAALGIARARPPVSGLCPGCNVILVSMDTLRADHLGAYGYRRATSANIDHLAAGAVVFEDAVSQSSWTRPAHASMFTGLYPSEHGVVGMAHRPMLPSGLRTLAEVLAAAGYRTAGFTGGGNVSAHFGFGRGFDHYTTLGRRFEDNLEAALAYMADSDPRAFFLFLHAFDAHKPYRGQPQDRAALGFDEERPGGMSKVCKSGDADVDLAPYVENYDAAIRRGDRSLGRLLDALAAGPAADSTVVLFTSDHGEEFFEHGGCFHVRTLYREVLQVPLIMAVPGMAPRRVPSVVPASVAVAPTILDLVGVTSHDIPGPSLVPYLQGLTPAVLPTVVSETSTRPRDETRGHLRALTTDQEKIVDWVTAGHRQFFDRVQDPLELTPLRQPRVRLQRTLTSWIKRHPPRGLPARADRVTGALRRRLRALGYMNEDAG